MDERNHSFFGVLTGGRDKLVFDENTAPVAPLIPTDPGCHDAPDFVRSRFRFDDVETMTKLVVRCLVAIDNLRSRRDD
jgi:hypothetical protein